MLMSFNHFGKLETELSQKGNASTSYSFPEPRKLLIGVFTDKQYQKTQALVGFKLMTFIKGSQELFNVRIKVLKFFTIERLDVTRWDSNPSVMPFSESFKI